MIFFYWILKLFQQCAIFVVIFYPIIDICYCHKLPKTSVIIISCFTGPIASIFWLDEELCSDIFLDGKFCLFIY